MTRLLGPALIANDALNHAQYGPAMQYRGATFKSKVNGTFII